MSFKLNKIIILNKSQVLPFSLEEAENVEEEFDLNIDILIFVVQICIIDY